MAILPYLGLSLPRHVVLLTPVDGNLLQRRSAECVPILLDIVSTEGALKIPECTATMDVIEEFLANCIGLDGMRELLHDGPLVNVKLRRELLIAYAEPG